MARVTVHPTADFVMRLSEIEARDLAQTLGEIYNVEGLPDNVVRIWQTLNTEVINFDSRHIDGE